jgi:uncharacterized pyridoxal phosphate-dependent enzyme
MRYLTRFVDGLRRGSTRRQVLRGGGLLAAGWLFPVPGLSARGAQPRQPAVESPYRALGVRPLINARGTVTIVGASRVPPEVKQAMDAATREYVQIDELMESVGRRLAQLTGAPWGIVTSGASAALTVATAGCITGGDPDKMAQLPDLRGLKDEVVVPRYSRTAYDHAVRAAGATVVEVETVAELEAALGPRSAMVMVLAGRRSQQGPLSLSDIAGVAGPRGVPILVDAAADELVVPNPYLSQGADLVAYSGGKCLRGPQCAGLLLGGEGLVRAAWINSAPHHGVGRGYKVGREEILGMLAAVEAWMKRDHAADQRTWNAWLEHIAVKVAEVPGVTSTILQPEGLSNRTPTLRVEWDPAVIPLTGHEVETLLWDGEPRVAVGGAGSFLPFPPNDQPNISIVPYQLEAGEERTVGDRVRAVLAGPHRAPEPPMAPQADISGQWDVELRFAAGTAMQVFSIEQKGNALLGTHYASFANRDLAGTIQGNEVLLRSSCTQRGVRLNFTFKGKVDGPAMSGSLSMGEYGPAEWLATRRTYHGPGARRAG